jgi:hypothetical protein
MTTFTIDSENKITALESQAAAEQNAMSGAGRFSSLEEFAKVAHDWPLSRLVAIWNGLPGWTPVSRFTDRKTALARIWRVLQSPHQADAAKRVRHGRKKVLAREGTKKARIVAMLNQAKGATLPDLMRATGWQAHSVRGFISGNLVKRMGLKVNSSRSAGGARSYRILRG